MGAVTMKMARIARTERGKDLDTKRQASLAKAKKKAPKKTETKKTETKKTETKESE